ncbi:MAG: hypothetical protein KC589_02225 [Nanoarchaeota archaeon]|nr:hypothetical protein [Nanoarchaeota archaeon]MCA9495733.1 hypothetical protein [Nanoarchaeota archaeon]
MFDRYILKFEHAEIYDILGIKPQNRFVNINGTLLREGLFINPLSQIELSIPRDSNLTEQILNLNQIIKPYDDIRTYLNVYSFFSKPNFEINNSATTKLKKPEISIGMFECGILCLLNQSEATNMATKSNLDLVDRLRNSAAV